MKKMVFLFLLLSNCYAFDNFPITGWEPVQGRYGVVKLKTYPQVELILDCNSFLHGVSATSANGSNFLMLYESECHGIFDSLLNWFLAGEKACLKLDFKQKDWALEKTTDGCR